MTKQNLEITPEMYRCLDYVNTTNINVFLTGKAGSGKTTFLKYLLERCNKRAIIVAPTGVAAINAGGVTIHSMFQLPHIPFLPEFRKEFDNNAIRKEKRKVISMLDLLVIDEISMVRADLLDAIDYRLKRIRRSMLPFGGVQLLMIGDLQQLAPVLTTEEEPMFHTHYTTPYFFGSKALNESGFATIELKKIFRQTDEEFLNILNAVRTNAITNCILQKLNERYSPSYAPSKGTVYVCALVKEAAAVNEKQYKALKSPEFLFRGSVKGNFPEQYPVETELRLKEGTQVMFVRNNTRLNTFNGKIGIITEISDEKIIVTCKGGEEIAVEKEEWDNIAYEPNDETGVIEAKTVGTFTQYPLRYAWAITIHKSQGLTFDEALIDANSSFSHGQVYVALSRCRTLEGLHLKAPLRTEAVRTDNAIDDFMDYQLTTVATDVEKNLAQYKAQYMLDVVTQAYSFKDMEQNLSLFCTELLGAGFEKRQPDLAKGVEELNVQFNNTIYSIAVQFNNEYHSLIMNSPMPLADDNINKRLTAGAKYFLSKLEALPHPFLTAGKVDIDSENIKELYETYSTGYLRGLYTSIRVMKEVAQKGFMPDLYFSTRSSAETAFDARGNRAFKDVLQIEVNTAPKTTLIDKNLMDILVRWRNEKAKEIEKPAFIVLHQTTLVAICKVKPLDMFALENIEGIGKKKMEQYGEEILTLVRKYVSDTTVKPDLAEVVVPEKTIKPVFEKVVVPEKKEPKEKKPSTYDITFELLSRGKTIEEIAKERGLSLATIGGHIIKFAFEGKYDLKDYLQSEDFKRVSDIVKKNPETTYAELEEIFGAKLSFLLELLAYSRIDEMKTKDFTPTDDTLKNVEALIGMKCNTTEIAYTLKIAPRQAEEKITELFEMGRIQLSQIVSQKKQEKIIALLNYVKEEQTNTYLRARLPYDYTFMDIRCVRISLAREESK